MYKRMCKCVCIYYSRVDEVHEMLAEYLNRWFDFQNFVVLDSPYIRLVMYRVNYVFLEINYVIAL